MKKVLFIIFVLIINISLSTAQWVTIPDANFVTKLTQLYPSCMNGNQLNTSCSQIVNETSINLSYSSIANINGIQYFTNLTDLLVYGNQLTALPSLPNSLLILNCSGNQLNSLPNIPYQLQQLDCSANNLSSFPTLPSTLTHLICSSNPILNWPVLPNSLLNLECNYNQLSTLPALPSGLEYLDCYMNQLTSLPALPNSISHFNCHSNQLTSLPVLPSNLYFLDCYNNLLTSLPALPSLLTVLYCDKNLLPNLPVLPSNLEILWCDHNLLSSLPQLPNILSALRCNKNQLTSLPSIPNSLYELNCDSNQLTSLPLLPITMGTFYIQNNQIYCLENLPQVINITLANISNNNLSCVPNQTIYSLGLPICMYNDPINNPSNCNGVANMVGNIYSDFNVNCNYDTSDLHTENIPVKLYDNQNNFLQLSYTVDGKFSFSTLLPGTFQLKIDDTTLPFSMDCGQLNYQTAILDSANQTIQNLNFPVICDTTFDISTQYVTHQGIAFPGQPHTLFTNIINNQTWYNLNCNSINYSGAVTIQVSGPVTYISPAVNALTPIVNGNIFTYNISDFSSLLPSSFGLNLKTDTSALAGDLICVSVTIAPAPIDADTSNNHYNFCYNVVNSYDPNMKEVYPVNVLPGYDDWFTYTIHFQNTGNAPAFNIRLRDTLDSQLNFNTFEVIGSSHAAITTLYGNILAVRFNDIMLPDSTTDYNGSMGYFQYRIKPLPNLPLGSQIENTAYIYFDYNAPIVTNTTQNNFDFLTNVKQYSISKNEFILYPNPSNGIFSFSDNSKVKTVEVINLIGEQILSQTTQKQINLSNYSKGIYFAKINGEKVIKLVKE
jgi:uncharacterized repeat protein (TIGR01451 family)